MMYENELNDELEDWADRKPKTLITFLVEFLTEDTYWLKSNISNADKELLINAVKYLQ